jgi:glycosyltransferase involved in cell wall biosynthesis
MQNHSVENIDIIHAHTVFPAGVAAKQIAEKYKKPFIITTHGADFYKCIPDISKLRKINPYSMKERNLVLEVLNNANNVICVSEGFARDVKDFSPKANVQVIPNDYSEELFFPQDKNMTREILGIPKSKRVILSVGNFVETKGHDYLIKAISSIVHHNPEIMLILIGGGELRKQYKRTCARLNLTKNVMILDKVNHENLANWYNAADIFVLPSINETFGIVLLEAAACGLPIIATNTAGPSQVIDDGVDGLIVTKKNVKELSDAILSLLSNENKLREIGNNALKNIPTKFAKTTDSIIDIYKRIMK